MVVACALFVFIDVSDGSIQLPGDTMARWTLSPADERTVGEWMDRWMDVLVSLELRILPVRGWDQTDPGLGGRLGLHADDNGR